LNGGAIERLEAFEMASAVERLLSLNLKLETLNRSKALNIAERLNGLNCLNVWNGYFIGNRDLGCQKIFNGVT
jgi:hypothetical protein